LLAPPFARSDTVHLCVVLPVLHRSADLEDKNGVSLPSYRGDIINGPEFTEEARIPDPWCAAVLQWHHCGHEHNGGPERNCGIIKSRS